MNFADIQSKRDEIYAIADKYGVENIRVFGSVARGDSDDDSDVDLLVDFPNDFGLFEVLRFRREIQDYLHQKVDLVEEKAKINPIIWQRICDEVRPI